MAKGKTQKELAILLGIEGPTLVGLLDRLAHDGWIERREADYDRRAKTVHLRPKARELLRDINEVAASLRQELLSDMTFEEIAIANASAFKNQKTDRRTGMKWISKRKLLLGLGIVLTIFILVAAGLWLHYRLTHVVETDAHVDGEEIAIASRLPGWIIKRPVDEGYVIKKGDYFVESTIGSLGQD